MCKSKNDFNESYSPNLAFLRENKTEDPSVQAAG